MNKTQSRTTRSDAMVLFGLTGDLVHRKIFPALYAMAKRGVLDVPVVGVAASKLSAAQLRKRATDSLEQSWRWQEVPWYLRSGKFLAAIAAEVIVELKPPPQRLFADSAPVAGRANYLRFRLSPNSAVALAARVKLAGQEFTGEQREFYLCDERPGEESPYERLLGDAMAGNGALFTCEDAVESA